MENFNIAPLIETLGMDKASSDFISRVITALVLLTTAFILDRLTKIFINRGLNRFVKKTKTQWDDMILESGVLNRLAHIVPALILYNGAHLVFPQDSWGLPLVQKGVMVYIILVVTRVANSVLDVVDRIYRTYPISRRRPIKGYLQLVGIFLYSVGMILSVSVILDQSATVLLSGLGALTAVIMLVFKDSILGLVASVQLSANNMVQIGDWIEMPKYGADGDVIDITLQTIKVQNWDKTLTTIPIYALISDSFKNWRGMSESGGRRIKRTINIDVNSIQFLDQELYQRLQDIDLLKPYLDKKQQELAQHNSGKSTKRRSNIRSLTNIGTFRAYLEAYLRDHPLIHNDMTLMVRQKTAGPEGLPLEIYVFSKDTAWTHYEALQGDIFDHVYAVMPEFELRPFQAPSGWDIQSLEQRRN